MQGTGNPPLHCTDAVFVTGPGLARLTEQASARLVSAIMRSRGMHGFLQGVDDACFVCL